MPVLHASDGKGAAGEVADLGGIQAGGGWAVRRTCGGTRG
jgi:hypothetical protein